MNSQILLPAVLGYACCTGLLILIPFRAKKIISSAGKCKLPLRRDSLLKVLLLFVICFFLISVIFLNRLPLAGNFMVCAVGLLGFELGVRNFLVRKYGGIYENGIFLQYPFIAFENIDSIPVLGWEDSIESLESQTTLHVVLKDGTNIALLFESTDEMQKIIRLLVELYPSLEKKTD